MHSTYSRLLSAAIFVVIIQYPATAQNVLSLEQAVIRVLENNPKLKIADYEAQAMAARIRQSLQPPADRLSVGLENFAGTGETTAVRGIEATLSLSRTYELGGKAALRGEVAQGEALILNNQKDIDRLHLLADTAQRFLRVAANQERLRLAEETLDLARLTRKTVESRILAGRTAEVERQRVSIDIANQELELEHIRHELESSSVALASLWNERQPDFDRVDAAIFELNPLPDFNEVEVYLDRNPELTRYIRAEDLARSKIRLRQSSSRPDVDITAGLRYLGDSNDAAFMLMATLPLGSADRSRPGVEEAEALSQIEPLNFEQSRLELYAILFEIYQEMKHYLTAVESLNEKIIPATRQILDEYENGYTSGRYSLLELIQTQQLLWTTRSQYIENAVNYHNYRIEMDRLTGARITQW